MGQHNRVRDPQVLLESSALSWPPPDLEELERLDESGAFDPPLAEVNVVSEEDPAVAVAR